MLKKQQLYILVIGVALLIVVVAAYGYQNNKFKVEDDTNVNQEEIVLDEKKSIENEISPEATDAAVLGAEVIEEKKKETIEPSPVKQQYVLFYGETCPHCHVVMDWMDETGIDSRLDIARKEVYSNPQFSEQMKLAAQNCGITSMGVPFLYDASQKECVVGSTPIIDHLTAELKL